MKKLIIYFLSKRLKRLNGELDKCYENIDRWPEDENLYWLKEQIFCDISNTERWIAKFK